MKVARTSRERSFERFNPGEFPGGFKLLDQFPNLGFSLPRDSGGIQRPDLGFGPPDSPQTNGNGSRVQTLLNVKVVRAARTPPRSDDGWKPKDGLRHVCTPLGVVEHATDFN
jgi:hypothetical protein